MRVDNKRLEGRTDESRRQLTEFKWRLSEAERQLKEWKDQYFELKQMEEQDLKVKLEEGITHRRSKRGSWVRCTCNLQGLRRPESAEQ
jgi:hypothetical protein